VTPSPAIAALPDLSTPGLPSKDSPAKIHEAAQQFESLLIGQLLKTSREAGGGGWLGTDDDDAGATGMEMAEQQFAKMLAANGGLGLSKMIEAGLRARSK
jgi:flagellar protein FlgJ